MTDNNDRKDAEMSILTGRTEKWLGWLNECKVHKDDSKNVELTMINNTTLKILRDKVLFYLDSSSCNYKYLKRLELKAKLL